VTIPTALRRGSAIKFYYEAWSVEVPTKIRGSTTGRESSRDGLRSEIMTFGTAVPV
jgi:hypothetical protein